MHQTLHLLEPTTFPRIVRDELRTLQINLGYHCNQRCLHCHVAAGPHRKEAMSDATIGEVVEFLAQSGVRHVDITGGAPELHPRFRNFVQTVRSLGCRVTDRCNLTVLLEPGQEDLATFLAEHCVEIVASLPCYIEKNVDEQRGKGVYAKSIEALQLLNALGYGIPDSGKILNLMYNPVGPSLPPPQEPLEQDYRRELVTHHGIRFNNLFTLTNMPVKRFGSMLVSHGAFNEYMQLLKSAHRDCNLGRVMCRTLLSIDWQGFVYDCDFNQMLGLPAGGSSRPIHISEIRPDTLPGTPIRVADHCYACTAGTGSSCNGSLDQAVPSGTPAPAAAEQAG